MGASLLRNQEEKANICVICSYLDEWKHFVDSFFSLASFCLHVFLLGLYFGLLRNFEITGCIMIKSSIAFQHIVDEVQLEKEKLKSAFWVQEFG